MVDDIHRYLLNHCPRAVSYLYTLKEASGQPVTEADLNQLLVLLLRKAEMYSRMERGELK